MNPQTRMNCGTGRTVKRVKKKKVVFPSEIPHTNGIRFNKKNKVRIPHF